MAERQPCVCVSLRDAARSLTKLYDDALAPSGLLVTQYSLLQKVDAGGVLCRLYYTREDRVEEAAQLVEGAFRISSTTPEERALILEVVG